MRTVISCRRSVRGILNVVLLPVQNQSDQHVRGRLHLLMPMIFPQNNGQCQHRDNFRGRILRLWNDPVSVRALLTALLFLLMPDYQATGR